MIIKQFLKPDKRKIIFWIILILFTFFVIESGVDMCQRIGGKCLGMKESLSHHCEDYGMKNLPFKCRGVYGNRLCCTNEELMVKFIFNNTILVLISYFLSCLLAFGLEKIKDIMKFLKLEWRKISLLIFFLILINIYFFIPRGHFHHPWFIVILTPLSVFLCEQLSCLLIIPFSIIFWYVISSLVVWIYDKLKKKPQ